MNDRTALLAGSTGVVGSACLELLLSHAAYQKVVTFGRRPLELQHPKLQHHVIDFDRLDDFAELFQGDDLYSALGTTRKKAGSDAAFRKVDFDYAFQTAQLSAQNGATQLMLVSSVGSDPDSSFLYPRVKGELEEAVSQLDFATVRIYQPSILLDSREETRWGEVVANAFFRAVGALFGNRIWGKYQPIRAEQVAEAMIVTAQDEKKGIQRYASNEMVNIAEANRST